MHSKKQEGERWNCNLLKCQFAVLVTCNLWLHENGYEHMNYNKCQFTFVAFLGYVTAALNSFNNRFRNI